MNQDKKYKQYDIVILFCASEINIDGQFDEIVKNIYLGGQVRMDAAVDFAERVKIYFIVGGSEKKVTDMKSYLEKQFETYKLQDCPKIIRIKSDPDTTGNLWAVKLVLQKNQKLHLLTGKVGLMTNFYHLPRVMRFAADIFKDINVNFIPISSEAVITRHLSTYSTYQNAFVARVVQDIKGLRDWEDENYNKQTKVDDWCYECLDKDILIGLE
ncbi:MAG: hypothetical protein A2908_03595 [Candidatus Staskawiczbacteria bacterium RIFCSPLOWO2_01_FULL_38_12b]|uniref:Uncharacterized protein n=1 Tax=Candidatus Staskawiczbacteria bacterium RIFCSPLOWO2_01_FULL_38_12b TaxID=1802214 RepID=A0A1G2IEJ0_9BACT|nr:MAG: hypothetical protein A2908_03595 [Candidatus Staskawiczbacteria bacterium RIFCSPLOWO2_01_FULL_38_12b]